MFVSFLFLFGLVSCTTPSSPIKTPNGTTVKDAYKVTRDLSSKERSDLDKLFEDYKDTVKVLQPSTSKYNCHSYAWHNQSSTNDIWINSPGDDTYWLDGSYVKSTKAIGNKVSYCGGVDHSAIVHSNTHFISKWGPGPLVVHTPENSPYNSACVTYYKKK